MEWKLRALDAEGNPIEPKQESVQEPVQENVQEQVQETVKEEVKQEKPTEDGISQEQVEEQAEEQAKDNEQEKEEVVVSKPIELDDQSILNYLKERRNVEAESLDVLLNNDKEETQPLPEDVANFMKYRQETGRSFEDYARLQQDWNSVDDTNVLREYYKQEKPHLDAEEIDYLINEEFSFDSELDEEKDIKKKKIAYKEELYKARNYFEGIKEKYKAPLESREAEIPENYKEAFNFYNKYQEELDQESATQKDRSRIFQEKTNALFNDEFKGFEFKVGDKKQVFKPNDVSKVKENQLDINNFFSKHLDEKGIVKDAASYHKALFAATNADDLFKFAYEQGQADATEGLVKETKNIDMSVRSNTPTDTGGTKFRAVDSGDNFSFKIKKR
tara:strand:+ start:967 stop:2133 length:1167 start_codon:yes stop_codon:yes gene_type:complete